MMKKLTVIVLALAMMMTLLAGCGKAKPEETVPAQQMPASALPARSPLCSQDPLPKSGPG